MHVFSIHGIICKLIHKIIILTVSNYYKLIIISISFIFCWLYSKCHLLFVFVVASRFNLVARSQHTYMGAGCTTTSVAPASSAALSWAAAPPALATDVSCERLRSRSHCFSSRAPPPASAACGRKERLTRAQECAHVAKILPIQTQNMSN